MREEDTTGPRRKSALDRRARSLSPRAALLALVGVSACATPTPRPALPAVAAAVPTHAREGARGPAGGAPRGDMTTSAMGEAISSEAYRALLEAELALEAGRIPDALALLREAASHDPTSAYLLLRLAEGLLEAGAPDEARRAAEAALALAPDLVAAMHVLSAAQQAAGEMAAARKTLEAALARAPADRATATMLAEFLTEAGDLDGAERVVELHIERTGDSIDVALALARLIAEQGEPERALVHVERALGSREDDPRALALKLTLLWALGRMDGALAAAQALARASGDNPGVRGILLTAHALAGELDQARTLAGTWRADDTSDELKLLLGDAWERAGRFDDAIAALDSPAAARSSSLALRRELARLHLLAGDAARAAAVACGAPAGSAVSSELGAQLTSLCGRAQVKQGRTGDAVALVATAAQSPEETVARLDVLADVVAAGALDAARARALIDGLLAGASADAPSAEVVEAAARVHEGLGSAASARALLDEALRKRPSDPELLFALARHHERTGAPAPAAEIVERIMERGRRGIGELNFVAYALAEAGVRLDHARRLAWRALVQDPLNGYVTDTLGWCLVVAGETAAGLDVLRRAARLLPVDGEVWFHLAEAESRAGTREAALHAARKSLDLLDARSRVRVRAEALRRTLEEAR